jgi:protein-glutamine gamma-glutamyltransferase
VLRVRDAQRPRLRAAPQDGRVSSGAQVAVLPAAGRRATNMLRPTAQREAARPVVRLVSFAALSGYGVIRWETLLSPAPSGRLIGLWALAVLVAGTGPLLASRRARPIAIIGGILAVLAMFALAGIPVRWITHVRITVTANAIGNGLSALPGVLLPYIGINQWVRIVTTLGAGVLLLDAGLLLAFAPRTLGDVRRAAAALPLVALAIVPCTLLEPDKPYLQGLVLFALLAAFMWGERLRVRSVTAAIALAVLAGFGAVVTAPALDEHSPWINYEAIAASLAPAHIENFNWAQTYGPLVWPTNGTEVFDVKAKRVDYWKTEDMDIFDGIAWMDGLLPSDQPEPQTSERATAEWSQLIQVTLRAMNTTDVIGAGESGPPEDINEPVVEGNSPGTWTAGANLVPGDSYLIPTYSPRPSQTQMATDRDDYSDAGLQGYLTMTLPPGKNLDAQPDIIFPPFHSSEPVQSTIALFGTDSLALVRASPYARVYNLAQRLAKQSATPYDFVRNVERYLLHGYTYDLSPPTSTYPLVSFLLDTKRGYCQQFAGAAALLLRMGGVPARVAVGFTPGTYDSATHTYVVTDKDAHAWIEVWFAGYGWVRFDPTPPTTQKANGSLNPPTVKGSGANKPKPTSGSRRVDVGGGSTAAATSHGGSPVAIVVAALVGVLLVLAAGLWFLASRRRWEPPVDELLRELERALRRSGRPVGDGVTLVALEHRFRTSPDAAEYVRTLRLARFAAANERPTPKQRRALRSYLRAGLGLGGSLRALWALPPHVAVSLPTKLRRTARLH